MRNDFPARHIFSLLRSQIALMALLPLMLLLLACQPAKQQTASAQAKHYDLKGKVVSVNKAKKEVTISHEDIGDYMPAMTMAFPLKDEWAFDILTPGDQVGATLVVEPNAYWLENIVISKGATSPAERSAADTSLEPKIGAEVPDFSLVNQDSKRINLNQYRGKALLLTFIYTRCPLPDYCVLMSNNFAQIDQKLKDDPSLYDRTHLLSITIDPEYDTPKVLRSYGAAITGKYSDEKFAHWEFVTGQPPEIKRMAEYFGLTYFTEQNQISHSLRTAIIAPDGKLYKMYTGNDWKPEDVLRDVQTLLNNGTK